MLSFRLPVRQSYVTVLQSPHTQRVQSYIHDTPYTLSSSKTRPLLANGAPTLPVARGMEHTHLLPFSLSQPSPPGSHRVVTCTLAIFAMPPIAVWKATAVCMPLVTSFTNRSKISQGCPQSVHTASRGIAKPVRARENLCLCSLGSALSTCCGLGPPAQLTRLQGELLGSQETPTTKLSPCLLRLEQTDLYPHSFCFPQRPTASSLTQGSRQPAHVDWLF